MHDKTPTVSRSLQKGSQPLFSRVQLVNHKPQPLTPLYVHSDSGQMSPVHKLQKIKNSTTDILNKNSVINRGAVTKASYPCFVGMTPDYDNITLKSTLPGSFEKNMKSP